MSETAGETNSQNQVRHTSKYREETDPGSTGGRELRGQSPFCTPASGQPHIPSPQSLNPLWLTGALRICHSGVLTRQPAVAQVSVATDGGLGVRREWVPGRAGQDWRVGDSGQAGDPCDKVQSVLRARGRQGKGAELTSHLFSD